MRNIFSKLIENIISLLFTVVGSEILFYSMYRKFNIICFISIIILVLLLYISFDKVIELKRKGILLYLAIGVLMLGLCYIFIKMSSDVSSVTFYSWALGGGIIIGDYFGYVVGTVIFVSFVYSSLTYYFSVNTVRMPMMFLLGFIVSVLYTKNMYKGYSISLAIYIVLLFSLFLLNSKKEDVKWKTKTNIKTKHILTSGMGLVLVAFFISSLIPKTNKLPVINPLEGFKDFINGTLNSDMFNGEFNEDNFKVDGNIDRNINLSTTMNSNKVLYSFTGDNPGYLVDHNFNLYEDNKWKMDLGPSINDSEFENYMDKYTSIISENELDNELEETKEIIKGSQNLSDEIKDIKETRSYLNLKSNINLRVESNNIRFLTHPVNTILLKNNSYMYDSLWIDQFDIIVGELYNSSIKSGESYTETYIKDLPLENTLEDKLMRTMTKEKYLEIIKNNLSSEEYSKKKGDEFIIEDNYLKDSKSTTSRMKELSLDLTKDKESVFDKALNIEDYFHSGKYKYNLQLPEQKSGDNYIDFFIFEGKEGYCVQYATAMTLLCRASGIPARYVEGYSITDKDFNGSKYDVKESNGHAFVQVYIPGYGWKVFDPTPSLDEESNDKESSKNSFLSNIDPIIIIVVIVVLVLVALAILIWLHFTKRSRFFKKINRFSRADALEAIMRDSIKLLKIAGLSPYKGETLLNFAKRVDNDISIGFEEVIIPYYNYKYAFKPLDEGVLEKAKILNERIYKYIKEK